MRSDPPRPRARRGRRAWPALAACLLAAGHFTAPVAGAQTALVEARVGNPYAGAKV